MSGLIVGLITCRIFLDLVYPGEKPSLGVGFYVVLVGITIALVARRSRGPDMLVSLLLCASMAIPLTGVPRSAVVAQVNFSAQIALPTMLLLLLSGAREVDFDNVRWWSLRIVLPVAGALFWLVVLAPPEGEDLLTYLNENPLHTVAQIVAKLGILSVRWPIAIPALVVVALITLNVRSAVVGFTGALVVSRATSVVAAGGLIIATIAGAAILDLAIPEGTQGLLSRLIDRGRSEHLDGSFNSLASGRPEIWHHYYQELLTEGSLISWLFGAGAVWIYHDPIEGIKPFVLGGDAVLQAHNDLLNLLVCYGVVGSALVGWCWYNILRRIHPDFRASSCIVFIVLFVTNGVVFHQSNVLFALFFVRHVGLASMRGRVEGVFKPNVNRAQPAIQVRSGPG